MKVPGCAEEEAAFSQCWKYSTVVFYSLRCGVWVVSRVSSYVGRARCDVVCVVTSCALRNVQSFSTDTNRNFDGPSSL